MCEQKVTVKSDWKKIAGRPTGHSCLSVQFFSIQEGKNLWYALVRWLCDTSLQFTLTPDTHAYLDLKFCPTWLNNIQHYNVQKNTWTFWMLVPFPEISSQFFICMFYHPLYNCFKYFPSAKRELLFSGSLRLCKFIAFSCRLNLIICLLRVKQLWMVGFICLELTSRWWNGQC